MAKKGQKFNNYTKEFKEKVIKEKLIKGGSYRYLSKKYNIPEGTIITWVDRYKKDGNQLIERKHGRPKNEEIDYKERYEILKKFLEYEKEDKRKKK